MQKRRLQFVSGRRGAHCWAGREASWYLGAPPLPRPPDALVLLRCPQCAGSGQLPEGSALLDVGWGLPQDAAVSTPLTSCLWVSAGHRLLADPGRAQMLRPQLLSPAPQ